MSYTNNLFKIDNVPDEVIRERLITPLSNGDVERYFGSGTESEILKYSDLDNYNTIDDLLPKPFDYRILLIETKQNVGHWVLILKYNNTIEYFNSYGVNADIQKNTLNRMMNRMLGQKEDYITKLLKNSKYKYTINNIPFQSKNPQIATCGRWCIIRILTAEKTGMNLPAFTSYVLRNCEKMRVSPDEFVSIFIT